MRVSGPLRPPFCAAPVTREQARQRLFWTCKVWACQPTVEGRELPEAAAAHRCDGLPVLSTARIPCEIPERLAPLPDVTYHGYAADPVPPQVALRTVVVLSLFSGERRSVDIQQCLESGRSAVH